MGMENRIRASLDTLASVTASLILAFFWFLTLIATLEAACSAHYCNDPVVVGGAQEGNSSHYNVMNTLQQAGEGNSSHYNSEVGRLVALFTVPVTPSGGYSGYFAKIITQAPLAVQEIIQQPCAIWIIILLVVIFFIIFATRKKKKKPILEEI
jgi:hypothetical protein